MGPSWAIASDSASPTAQGEPSKRQDPLFKVTEFHQYRQRSWLSIEWPSLCASSITLRLHCTCLICSKFAASSPQLLWSSSTEAQNETSREKKNVRKRPCNQIKLTVSNKFDRELSSQFSCYSIFSKWGKRTCKCVLTACLDVVMLKSLHQLRHHSQECFSPCKHKELNWSN